jgi:hypothetical protein
MSRKYDFFAERASFGRRININMAHRLPSGVVYGDVGAPLKRSVATSIVYTEVEPDDMQPMDSPLLSLMLPDAQALMDELWQAGVRPANGEGSTGQLAATETHLKDMRAIAFELLAMETKP